MLKLSQTDRKRRLAGDRDGATHHIGVYSLETYFHWFDLLGVAVFAISGTLMAYRKHMDGFGAIVLASVTAIGGGTLRDIILDLPVFWVQDGSFLLAIFAATFFTIAVLRVQAPLGIRGPQLPLLLADAVGLSFFVVMGTQKALEHGTSDLIAIVMGTITGSFGGLIRDVICHETPLVLKGELYATCAIVGGLIYTQSLHYSINPHSAMIYAMLGCLMLRLAALRWHLSIPVFSEH